MTLLKKLDKINRIKFSFAKSTEFSESFARSCGAKSMYDPGLGLEIPSDLSDGNKLRAVFNLVMQQNGVFLFNISGVNMNRAKKKFSSYEEAEEEGQITEWELFMIISNRDYLKNSIFHNGKIEFKKRIIWNSIA